MIESLRQLIEHARWADRLALDSLRRARAVPPRALATFAHVIAAQRLWLSRLEGEPPGVAVWPSFELGACAALMHETHVALEAYARGLDDAAPGRTVHYRNSAGVEFDSKIDDILMHVMLHSAYHRGQVAMLLRNAGEEPEPTDYIAFCRGAPAARS
ncbi:MAG: DinB family protein [Longimicrobiales bacterium]